MFTKNFNSLPDSLIEASKKIMTEGAKKTSKNPSSINYDHEDDYERREIDDHIRDADAEYDKAKREKNKKMSEASNEEPNINHLELSEEDIDEALSADAIRRRDRILARRARLAKANVATDKAAKDAYKSIKSQANSPKSGLAPLKKSTPRDSDDDEGPHIDPETGEKDLVPAKKHIMNQLRQAAQSMKAQHPVTFADGKTHSVPKHVAKDLVNHYNSIQKPYERENLQSKIGQSHDSLMKHHSTISEASFNPNPKGNKKMIIEKKPKKIEEIPIETQKEIKRDYQNEEVNEREMTKAEMNKREKLVMRLKDKMAGFKKRYGERAKDVMYATATKMAMKEETPKGRTMTGQNADSVKLNPSGPTKEGVGIKSTTT